MTYDPTPLSGEILTPTAAPGETEPRLTLTQLQGLLREAAALERAQRPIVLHGPEAHPAPATRAAAHSGIDVRVPASPVALAAARHSERSLWPVVFIASGITGALASLMTAVTESPYAILAVFASAAVWGTALYQLVFVQDWK